MSKCRTASGKSLLLPWRCHNRVEVVLLNKRIVLNVFVPQSTWRVLDCDLMLVAGMMKHVSWARRCIRSPSKVGAHLPALYKHADSVPGVWHERWGFYCALCSWDNHHRIRCFIRELRRGHTSAPVIYYRCLSAPGYMGMSAEQAPAVKTWYVGLYFIYGN